MTNSRNDADQLATLAFQSVDGHDFISPPHVDPADPASSDPVLVRRARSMAVAAAVAYTLFDLILPLIPYHRRTFHLPFTFYTRLVFDSRILAFYVAPTALFMLLQLWLARSLVALRWTARQSGIAAVSALAGWGIALAAGNAVRHMTRLEAFAFAHLSPLVFTLALTVALTALGVLLSRIVREPNVLLPVALIAMPIDYVGAMTSVGFTNNVVRHAPDVVSHVSLHVPHLSGIQVFAEIGPGDALFIAFFLAAVQRLKLNLSGTFWWMFGLLTLAIVEVLLKGFPIAALVPMGIAVVAANWRYFSLKRSEVFAVVYAILIIFALVLAFFLISARHFAR